MKTIGRGHDYKKALIGNLLLHLSRYHRVQTTKFRARLLMQYAPKALEGTVRVTNIMRRRGDGAAQAIVELVKKEAYHEDKADTTERHSKNMASR